MHKPACLECSRCGGVAVESRNGLFYEDDADRCGACGVPGHISIDDSGGCYSGCAEDACTCGIAHFVVDAKNALVKK
jgi:hypothetical protein